MRGRGDQNPGKIRHRALVYAGMACIAGLLVLATTVRYSLRPFPDTLILSADGAKKRQVVARNGRPLSYTFATGFNLSDSRPLHKIPHLLQRAFIEAEDRRFYEHSGVDWRARLHAVWQNIRAGRIVRGASTISEQVVRMLHPRPRSLWARVIEGIEATQLEARFSKRDIFEFYVNQVPYAGNRRGVVQAARYFWDRDLETLNEKELLALAVMVRAPERLDLFKGTERVDSGVSRLAAQVHRVGALSDEQRAGIKNGSFALAQGSLPVRADHFVLHIQRQIRDDSSGTIHSTLHSEIQRAVQRILDNRVKDLSKKGVSDGAVLVVDNHSGEVLAWVNAGEFGVDEGSQIDAVVTPRQPGSTLKPFLYALALGGELNAATILTDAPLAEPVGAGLHNYRNYSRMYYGDISVREALGNSLNIPAIKTIQRLGESNFLSFLHDAGFDSLAKPADFYGEGLALGNGEVTLFELVQGYAALANRGVWRPLRVTRNTDTSRHETRVRKLVTPEVSSIIGHILSDPQARRREFGSDSLLRFPVQTAVKTGTSTDYRDAWAIGFSEAFTVGVWMGNLNRSSMHEISGARGPALVLRSVFAELHRHHETNPLYLSPYLQRREVCPLTGALASPRCPHVEELFVAGREPTARCSETHLGIVEENPAFHTTERVRITMPTPGLNFARDPRIPDRLEVLPLELDAPGEVHEVHWLIDGEEIGITPAGTRNYTWKLVPGHHTVRALVIPRSGEPPLQTSPVGFWVR